MKKLAALLMVLSLGVMMVGCEASTEVDTAPPPAVDGDMDTGADPAYDADAGLDADAGPGADDAGADVDLDIDNP